MPVGDKDKYTDKQKRQAEHIEESYEERGYSQEEAESIAWATVNKQDGGGKQGGSGEKGADKEARSTTHQSAAAAKQRKVKGGDHGTNR